MGGSSIYNGTWWVLKGWDCVCGGAQTGHFLLHLPPTDVMEMKPLVHSVEQGPGLRAEGDVQM